MVALDSKLGLGPLVLKDLEIEKEDQGQHSATTQV